MLNGKEKTYETEETLKVLISIWIFLTKNKLLFNQDQYKKVIAIIEK